MIEQLYRQHYQKLLRYCVTLTHSQALAEDIVQDAFMRALANAHILNEMPEAKCLGWLYTTARNLYIDHARRMKKAPAPETEGIFESDLSIVHVIQWLDKLPDSERALFSLRYFQGFNATELGEMFNLPPSTVRARLLSARKTLQTLIQAS